MATGGYDGGDSRVTCSICLEPYKGRQPKLLPCSHTFCLPCLTQIADKEAASPKIVHGSDEDDRVVTITCPTCRTPVPLPPGGVAKLHNNIYVDGSDEPSGTPPPPSSLRPSTKPQRINCDLCEEGQGQEAKFTCSVCRASFCTRCRRTHDRLCKSCQVTEIEVQQSVGDKDLASSFDQMMKRMSELEKTVATQQTLIAGLQSHVNGLHNQKLNDKNTHLEKQSKRDRYAVTSLEKELISLKQNNAIMCQDNQEIHNDVSKVQEAVSKVQDDLTEQKKSMKKLDKQVAFHAIKTIDAQLKKDEAVICDMVISNVGVGYNGHNGVFTAPVSGVYCFIASSTPDQMELESSVIQYCKLDIIVDEEDVAFLSAGDNTRGTAHCAVRVNAGQKVWLRVCENGHFAGACLTSFTGMLVQPDL